MPVFCLASFKLFYVRIRLFKLPCFVFMSRWIVCILHVLPRRHVVVSFPGRRSLSIVVVVFFLYLRYHGSPFPFSDLFRGRQSSPLLLGTRGPACKRRFPRHRHGRGAFTHSSSLKRTNQSRYLCLDFSFTPKRITNTV